MYIYIATNIINKKQYVGQSIHLPYKQRISDHKKAKTGTAFHNAIRQYGLENFEWQIIPYLGASTESLNAIEYWYITKLNTLTPHGYNAKNKSKDNESKTAQQTSKLKRQKPSHNRSPVWEHQSEVINLYKKGYSSPEIANKLKSSPNIILNILKKNNIPRRSHSETLTGRPAHNRSYIWEIQDEIINLYQKEGLNCREIAEIFNVCKESVLNILVKNNIPRRSNSESHKGISTSKKSSAWNHQPEIINFYKKGYSQREISKKFNVSSTTIGNILKKNNIPRRSPKEAKKKKYIRQLFDKKTTINR